MPSGRTIGGRATAADPPSAIEIPFTLSANRLEYLNSTSSARFVATASANPNEDLWPPRRASIQSPNAKLTAIDPSKTGRNFAWPHA
jgi:hypothetical protein